MSEIDVYPFKNNSPSYVSSIRDEIDMEPIYQRQGGVWPMPKRQLLIDSILNDFDLPKIYFHELGSPRVANGRRLRYALVDGKQRLGAIFDFLDNKFPLAADFKLLRDETVDAAGKTFRELSDTYPALVARFVSTALPIVVIRTDDIELIEELFSRLNEAVPLNAPEKRNAFHGPAPAAARKLIRHRFFTEKLPFSNTRYRHLDLAAKFLMWEDTWVSRPTIVRDVKKSQLDDFFRSIHRDPVGDQRIRTATRASEERLNMLAATFVDSDSLLTSVGMISVYYILWQDRQFNGRPLPNRASLKAFDELRRSPTAADEDEINLGHLALFEFNRLAQGPNDSSALVFRFRVLDTYLDAVANGQDALEAIGGHAPTQSEKD